MSDKKKTNLTWILGIVGGSCTLLHAFNCLCSQDDALIILGAIGVCMILSLFGKCKFSRLVGIMLIIVALIHLLIVLNVLASTEVQLIALAGDLSFVISGVFCILNKKRNAT